MSKSFETDSLKSALSDGPFTPRELVNVILDAKKEGKNPVEIKDQVPRFAGEGGRVGVVFLTIMIGGRKARLKFPPTKLASRVPQERQHGISLTFNSADRKMHSDVLENYTNLSEKNYKYSSDNRLTAFSLELLYECIADAVNKKYIDSGKKNIKFASGAVKKSFTNLQFKPIVQKTTQDDVLLEEPKVRVKVPTKKDSSGVVLVTAELENVIVNKQGEHEFKRIKNVTDANVHEIFTSGTIVTGLVDVSLCFSNHGISAPAKLISAVVKTGSGVVNNRVELSDEQKAMMVTSLDEEEDEYGDEGSGNENDVTNENVTDNLVEEGHQTQNSNVEEESHQMQEVMKKLVSSK